MFFIIQHFSSESWMDTRMPKRQKFLRSTNIDWWSSIGRYLLTLISRGMERIVSNKIIMSQSWKEKNRVEQTVHTTVPIELMHSIEHTIVHSLSVAFASLRGQFFAAGKKPMLSMSPDIVACGNNFDVSFLLWTVWSTSFSFFGLTTQRAILKSNKTEHPFSKC